VGHAEGTQEPDPARLAAARAAEAETVTSAGISAGIDMALKVVQRYFGADIARATARHMEFPYPDSDARRVQL